MDKEPKIKRKYMIAYLDEREKINFVKLQSDNYEDALKIAKCFCGKKAETALVYKDFTVYD